MQRATFILLLVGFVLGKSQKHETSHESEHNLSEKVKTMNDVLKIYVDRLEAVVPFKEIQSSIEGLDLMSVNYNGNCCTTFIDQAGDSGHLAIDQYYRGTDLLVTWCSTAKRMFGYVVSQDSITEDKVEKIVGTTINKGFQAFNGSLQYLDIVMNKFTNMQHNLEPIPAKLKLELIKLQAIHEQDIANKRKTEKWVTRGLAAFSSLVSYVLTASLGPAGTAIGMASQMILKGIPQKVIEGQMIPNANQKMKIVEAYYECLIDTALSANNNVTVVADEFKQSFVDKLRPWAKDESSDDSKSGNEDSGNSKLVIAEVKQLLTTVEQFLHRYIPSDSSREITHVVMSPVYPYTRTAPVRKNLNLKKYVALNEF